MKEVEMAKQGGSYRSATSGRYVRSSYGKANPHTTVKEAPGPSVNSGTQYRSAISGRYVSTKYGKSHPRTTLREDE